jgi:hypothetical protein
LVVTLPRLELVPFKNALKAVEWNMLLFMAATLKLGDGLVESGAVELIVRNAFQSLDNAAARALNPPTKRAEPPPSKASISRRFKTRPTGRSSSSGSSI